MDNKNDKKKPFFIKKYGKVISEFKDREQSDDYVREVIVERNSGFNTFEVLIIIVISVLFGMIVGYVLNSDKNSLVGEEVSPEVEEFVSTYNNILENYYDALDEQELMNAAISGMISSLDDPYSSFMDTDASESFNQTIDGAYVGIGITVEWKDGKSCIVDMFDDSPAKRAGLKVNDIIVKVGKKDVSNMSLHEVSDLIKGKSGTKVKITVLRDEKEISFSVTRGEVEVPSVSSKIINKDGKKIGYIYIETFAANTFKQFSKELKKLEKKEIESLILDVRDNPGGHLSQVGKILEMFFGKKTVLYQVETKGKKEKIYSKNSDKRNYPVVVIVNGSSASASEILASSFQDNYKNAVIIGTTTYGKGTIQKAIGLSNGATLKYTSQKWLTAKGKWINEKGIIPDEIVEQGSDYSNDSSEENDTQLQKAIELLLQKESN